jgi:type VI protein secretion system component VasF
MDDLIAELEFTNQRYLDDLDKLSAVRDQLEDEVKELNEAVDSLCEENNQLEQDNRDARRTFTAFQMSVCLLVFAYGMFYGAYLHC